MNDYKLSDVMHLNKLKIEELYSLYVSDKYSQKQKINLIITLNKRLMNIPYTQDKENYDLSFKKIKKSMFSNCIGKHNDISEVLLSSYKNFDFHNMLTSDMVKLFIHFQTNFECRDSNKKQFISMNSFLDTRISLQVKYDHYLEMKLKDESKININDEENQNKSFKNNSKNKKKRKTEDISKDQNQNDNLKDTNETNESWEISSNCSSIQTRNSDDSKSSKHCKKPSKNKGNPSPSYVNCYHSREHIDGNTCSCDFCVQFPYPNISLAQLKNICFAKKLTVREMYAILESNCFKNSELKNMRNQLYSVIDLDINSELPMHEKSAEYILEKSRLIREYRFLSKDSKNLHSLSQKIDAHEVMSMSTTHLVSLKFAMRGEEVQADVSNDDILKVLRNELDIRINVRILVNRYLDKMAFTTKPISHIADEAIKSENKKIDSFSNLNEFVFSDNDLINPSFVNNIPIQSLYNIYISDRKRKIKNLAKCRLFNIIEYDDTVDLESIGYKFAASLIRKDFHPIQMNEYKLLQLYLSAGFAEKGLANILSLEKIINNHPEHKNKKRSYELLEKVIKEHTLANMKYHEYLCRNNLEHYTINCEQDNDSIVEKNEPNKRKDSLNSNASSENHINICSLKKLFNLNDLKINNRIGKFQKSISEDYCNTIIKSKEYKETIEKLKNYTKSEIKSKINDKINSSILNHYNKCTTDLLSTKELINLLGFIKNLNITDPPKKEQMNIIKERHAPFCKLDARITKLVKLNLFIQYENSLKQDFSKIKSNKDTNDSNVTTNWSDQNLNNIEFVSKISFANLCFILESPDIDNSSKSIVLEVCNKEIEEYYNSDPRQYEEELNKKLFDILKIYSSNEKSICEDLNSTYSDLSTAPLNHLIRLKMNAGNLSDHNELNARVCRAIVIDYHAKLEVNMLDLNYVKSLSLHDLFHYADNSMIRKLNREKSVMRCKSIVSKCKLDMTTDEWQLREVKIKSKIDTSSISHKLMDCKEIDDNDIMRIINSDPLNIPLDRLLLYRTHLQSNNSKHCIVIDSVMKTKIGRQVALEYLMDTDSLAPFLCLKLRYIQLMDDLRHPFTNVNRFDIQTSLVRGLQLDIQDRKGYYDDAYYIAGAQELHYLIEYIEGDCIDEKGRAFSFSGNSKMFSLSIIRDLRDLYLASSDNVELVDPKNNVKYAEYNLPEVNNDPGINPTNPKQSSASDKFQLNLSESSFDEINKYDEALLKDPYHIKSISIEELKSIIRSPYIVDKDLARQHLAQTVNSVRMLNYYDFTVVSANIHRYQASRPYHRWRQGDEVPSKPRQPLELAALPQLLVYADYYRCLDSDDTIEINVNSDVIDIGDTLSASRDKTKTSFCKGMLSGMMNMMKNVSKKKKNTSGTLHNEPPLKVSAEYTVPFQSLKAQDPLLADVINEITGRCEVLAVETLMSESRTKQRFVSIFSEYLLKYTAGPGGDPAAGLGDLHCHQQPLVRRLWLLLMSTAYPVDSMALSCRYKRHLSFLDHLASQRTTAFTPDSLPRHSSSTEHRQPYADCSLWDSLLGQLSHVCRRAILLAVDAETSAARLPPTSLELQQGRDDHEYDSICAIHDRVYSAVDGLKDFKVKMSSINAFLPDPNINCNFEEKTPTLTNPNDINSYKAAYNELKEILEHNKLQNIEMNKKINIYRNTMKMLRATLTEENLQNLQVSYKERDFNNKTINDLCFRNECLQQVLKLNYNVKMSGE